MREEKASALPLLLDVRRMDENNRAYAYRMLRKNIMTLQLQPGCQLSAAELCEQLARSRTPVHEALMMLKSEWLVDVLPQRGSIVSKISVPYLNEGFAMRRILEPALLRGLAGYIAGELHTDVAIAPDPLNCVARGTAISLSEGKYLSAGFRDATPKVWNRRLNHSHDPFTGE